MTKIPGGQAPTLVDNPNAPEVFADAPSGWQVLNGNIRITFESVRANHAISPISVNRVVIGRLVMPVASAENFARELLDFLETQKKTQVPPGQASTHTIQ